ncbi:MAG: hypothetical protein EAY81_11195 [Bacteroidetes bacterium]|nr:MAG: hypothetical protein EAY81_11195 [Bacteroidota bacterium]
MKTIQFMNYRLATFLVAFALLFASCDNPIFDPGGDGGGNGKPKDPPPTSCNVKGTIVRVTCGFGVYGELWIKTEHGKYLQPCQQSFMPQVPVDVKEGDQVEFGYTVQKDSLCDSDEIRCLAALPAYQPVTITCIRVVDKKPVDTCPKIVIDHTKYEPSVIQILESEMDGNFLKLTVGYSGGSQVENSDFSLSWKGEIEKSNPPLAKLQLFSPKVVEGNVLQAYFTNNLCFDVSAIKAQTNSSRVRLQIGEHEILF